MKPILVERYADNGQLSHYELIDDEGNILWTQSDESPSPSLQEAAEAQQRFAEDIVGAVIKYYKIDGFDNAEWLKRKILESYYFFPNIPPDGIDVLSKAGNYAHEWELKMGEDAHPKTASFQGFVAGWNAREAQQTGVTLGYLIIIGGGVINLDESKKEITEPVWEKLLNDDYCPNSIPILYIKRLMQTLGIPFYLAAAAIRNTFAIYRANNPIPIEGNQARHLWENDESIDKYIFRLIQLLKDTQQTAPLLTREVFDKIWEAATRWADVGNIDNNPDKETFFKSLNL